MADSKSGKGSSLGGGKRGAQGKATMNLTQAKAFANAGKSKPNLNAKPPKAAKSK